MITKNTYVDKFDINFIVDKNSNYTLGTSAFEEIRSEFINFTCNCVINTLRLIVYLTGFSI